MYAHQVVKPSGQTATDTKTRILDAADKIFVRRGIDGARMTAQFPALGLPRKRIIVR